VNEARNLRSVLSLPEDANCLTMSRRIGGATVLLKGEQDVVSDGTRIVQLSRGGSPRRVGGQGDILAGALGLFCSWAPTDYIPAAAAASEVVKRASSAAYARKGRSFIASDMLSELPGVLPSSWSSFRTG
jgi:ATP-dependent NAD(P)H-hydrate dehydratase